MQVHLTNAGAITLREPNVFNRLDVLVDPQSDGQQAQAIARIGHREGEHHVRLAPSVLRFLSGHAGQPEWEANFAAMLDFAKSRGWINEAGEVRAHLIHRQEDAVVSVEDFKAAMRAYYTDTHNLAEGAGAAAGPASVTQAGVGPSVPPKAEGA